MRTSTPDFSLAVAGVQGTCPVGERYAKEQMAEGRMPVLSCEGACIRGEIARLAANLVAKEVRGSRGPAMPRRSSCRIPR